jgi:hypothetical protein
MLYTYVILMIIEFPRKKCGHTVEAKARKFICIDPPKICSRNCLKVPRKKTDAKFCCVRRDIQLQYWRRQNTNTPCSAFEIPRGSHDHEREAPDNDEWGGGFCGPRLVRCSAASRVCRVRCVGGVASHGKTAPALIDPSDGRIMLEGCCERST